MFFSVEELYKTARRLKMNKELLKILERQGQYKSIVELFCQNSKNNEGKQW